jgi:tripartite-type tricarboxylate transporter receptor subunit TctC
MHMKTRYFLALFACAALALPLAALAQAYPARPVRIIVPFPPGGPADVLGRMFADKLQGMWNQPVLVDNRAGAAGNVGSEAAAKSAPDGYTVLLAASSHVTNAALYAKLPYDPIKDFTPISQVAYYSLVLVTHPSLPVASLGELIAYAKANPGRISWASAGSGTPTHLTAELFGIVTGIKFLHVPYKGAAPATTDLLGGQVQAMFNNPVSALPHVRSGQLRGLATTGAQRSPAAPDIPTVAELGFAGFEAGTWYALLGPAGMPKDIAAKVSADANAVLKMADVRAKLAAQGVEPVGTTPGQLLAIMNADLEKWTKVIRSANIKPD